MPRVIPPPLSEEALRMHCHCHKIVNLDGQAPLGSIEDGWNITGVFSDWCPLHSNDSQDELPEGI